MTKKDAINWFEINVADFDRAKRFYETILKSPLHEHSEGKCRMAIFSYEEGKGVGGTLKWQEGHTPGPGGTFIYLNAEGILDAVLERIPSAGGAVLQPRLGIGEHGVIGIFRDTEGNVVGLHSLK